jgi:type IV fimbrial biogenesis protein FimT
MHPKRRNSGFTIIELMVALVVLGIVIALGVPSLRDFLVSNRLTGDINSFVGLVNYARSEAITRNQRVIICPKSNTAITCQNSQLWNEFELQVFVDVDGNSARGAGDTLLKTIPAIDVAGAQTQFVCSTSGCNKLIFNAMGFSQSAVRLDIHTVKAGDTAYEFKYGRSLCVSKPGRVRVIPYSASACSSF